jgi:hypothetical protein
MKYRGDFESKHHSLYFRRCNMKFLSTLLIGLCLMFVSSASIFAQAVGDYRSAAPIPTGGVWNAAGNWQRWNGSAWALAPAPPTGSQVITILSTDSIYVNVAVSITGTLRNQGRVAPGSPSNLTIANGGTYDHAQDGGVIPTATWSTGSTCKVTGTVAVTSITGGGNQNFYNLVWDCATQTANTSIGAYGAIIGGNVTLVTSNTGRFYFMASNSGKTTINGNFAIQAGNFGTNGTGSLTNDTVVCNGNVVVTGGNFAVSRGSQGGTGTTTWYHYGDMSLSNCTSQNSNPTGGKFVFSKQGTQTLTLLNVTYGTGAGSPVNYDVASGSTLNLGTSDLGTAPNNSTGSFRVLSGASVFSGHPNGLNGNITSTGAQGGGNSFATDASYGFNGSVAQVTGSLMPTTVDTLTINNPAGVTLSQPTTINRRLRLRAGVFNNTIPFTLGPGASVSFEGGSLLVSVKSDGTTIPESFFVDQNYPNPFNPSTTVRFGLPNRSFVTAKVFNLLGQEVATLFQGHLEPGVHLVDLNASNLGSGIYLCRIQASSSVDIKRMILMK